MTTTGSVPGSAAELTADEFAERLLAATLATIETFSVYVGDRLGWYRALATHGPLTPTELAARTSTAERYVREWLEQQAVCGILTSDAGEVERRYALPPAAAEVLTDEHSLAYTGPLPRLWLATAKEMPRLLEAYRTGGGVSWEEFGDDARECQADMNRPWLEGQLGEVLRGVPEVDSVLSRPGARIADVGMGAGWSTIALARAYPQARIDGFDVDAPSVEMARRNAHAADVGDRVTFHVADGVQLSEANEFDAAFAFECVHDMSRPVEVLSAVREAVRPDGLVVIMDERVADEFTAPGDDVERLMYGFSLFCCLPDGMSSTPSAATGTVFRRSILERYASQAGFEAVEVLPIEGFGFWRFYRLVP